MKNEIKIVDEHVEIILKNRKKEVVGVALVDLEDLERVSMYAWSLNRATGYIQNTRSYHEGKGRYLHQFVLGIKEGLEIDHINQIKGDNRKVNLRHTTKSLNMLNVESSKGVTWDKSRNKWMAYIQIDRKVKYLGRYADKQDALNARKIALEAVFECLK